MLFDKLRQIEERSQEIARRLSDPAIFGRPVCGERGFPLALVATSRM